MKDPRKIKQGKKNKRLGREFEKLVRADLESQGVLVFKNTNDLINGKFTQSKSKWNPFTKRPMMLSPGFPDYLIFRAATCWNCQVHGFDNPCGFEIKFVECKSAKYLDAEEKKKVAWISEVLNIDTWIAFKNKDKKIEYVKAGERNG